MTLCHLDVGEGPLTVGHLSEAYLSPNKNVTANWKEMCTTVDGKEGYCSTLEGGYCLPVLEHSRDMT